MYSVSRNRATAHDMRLNLKVATESFANAADTAQLSSAKLTPRAPVTLGEGDRPIPAQRMRTPSHAAVRVDRRYQRSERPGLSSIVTSLSPSRHSMMPSVTREISKPCGLSAENVNMRTSPGATCCSAPSGSQ